ncbi:MAG: DUF3303 family protein [Mycobacterium sp.]
MKYAVAMKFRMDATVRDNEDAVRRLLDVYSKWTPPAGLKFHEFVGRVDGQGSFAVVETDDVRDLMDATSKFGPYAEYEIHPVLDVADTVNLAQEAIAFRESIS